MPENLIALEDCIVDNKGHTVLFVLPKYVMFERVEAVVDEEKYGNWHNHYPNQFGDLVVACDNVARFFAPGEVVRPYKGSYGENYLRLAFESYRTLGHWGERIYVHEHLK
ncbi:hypothetical protein KY328_04640, partial [Candidatus Woesearchaeota archaeon]|nr:hypothetical protein [Candidatus Woesearchaeota archaeon]